MKHCLRAAALAAALCLLSAGSLAEQTVFTDYTVRRQTRIELTNGVFYTHTSLTPKNLPAGMSQRIFTIEADPNVNPRLRVRNALSAGKVRDNLTVVSKTARESVRQSGESFLAAVNGDFFDEGQGGPLGCNMNDGEWLTMGEFPEGWSVGFTADGHMIIARPRARVFLSVTRDGRLILDQYPIDALNAPRLERAQKSIPDNAVRAREDNDTVLYTHWFDDYTRTKGGTELVLLTEDPLRTDRTVHGEIGEVYGTDDTQENTAARGLPLKEGRMVLSAAGESAAPLRALRPGDRFTLTCAADPAFDGAVVITGGGRPDQGPLLLWNGEKTDLEAAQAMTDDVEYFYPHHARCVAALREDGSWFFLVVEGNRSGSYGVTLAQLQTLLLDLGAYTAVNLDGGPSSTMVSAYPKADAFRANTDTSGGFRAETRVGNALVLTEQTE